MAKLDEILKGISNELIKMQEETDRKSLQVLQSYQENEILKHLDAPRFTISGVKLNLKFTVSDLNDLESFDFSKTRVKWFKYIKQVPVQYLTDISTKTKQDQFKKRIEQSFSKINPPDYQMRKHLIGKIDLVSISSNHIVSFLMTLPDVDKDLLPQKIESEIAATVQHVLSKFKKFSVPKQEINTLSSNWMSEIKKVPATIVTKESIDGLSIEETRAIKTSLYRSFESVGSYDFKIENALKETPNLKSVKFRDYCALLYNKLPDDFKRRIPPSNFLSGQLYGSVEEILENNLVLLHSTATESINHTIGRLWLQRMKLITDAISVDINKGLKNLEKPDPTGARSGNAPGHKRNILNPLTPLKFTFEPDKVESFNKVAPTITLQQVIKSNVTNSNVEKLAKLVYSTIPKDKQPKLSALTEVFRNKLKEILLDIKIELVAKVENQFAGLIKDFAVSYILTILSDSEKEAVFNELKSKSEQVQINNLNALIEKALLHEKDELLNQTRSVLMSVPDKMNVSLKQKISVSTFNANRISKEMNALFAKVFNQDVNNMVLELIQMYKTDWDEESKNAAVNNLSGLLLSYKTLIDSFSQSIEVASLKTESIIISDDDFMLATQHNKADTLINKSSYYLVKLLQSNEIPVNLRLNLPIAFLRDNSFTKLLEEKFISNKKGLKESIKTRALNELDINVKDSEIKNSSAINEISIDLTPNFIKLTDD